jgi:excisionase family DNA binding protein
MALRKFSVVGGGVRPRAHPAPTSAPFDSAVALDCRVLTVGEVARAVGVSPRRVRDAARAGHLRRLDLGGRRKLQFLSSAVEAWLISRQI